jgi:RimJ/RimL family protein N-acetyltransferase
VLFETERFLVRRLVADDVAALHAVYGDVEAMRWVGDGRPLARADCVRWVEVTDRNYATLGYGMAALMLRPGNDVIGFCGIVHPGGQPQPEIKYALRREFWGQGLATEAVRGMLKYGATSLRLHEIIATAAPQNLPSHRVLLKAGMIPAEPRHNEDGTLTQVFAWRSIGPARGL